MRRAALLSCLTAAVVAVLAVPVWAAEIAITDDGFSPERVQVEPGETIVWTNATDGTVTLSGDQPGWDSGPLTPGETFSVAFEQSGTYRYNATDIAMAGEIVVVAAGAAAGETDEPSGGDRGDRRGDRHGDGGGGRDGRGAGGPRIPETGVAATALSAVAGALLAAGGALVAAGRRRSG